MKSIDEFVNKIHCADCLDFMKEMPSSSVDMCITSPPYWGLRDYGVEQTFGGDKNCEHEWSIKNKKVRNGTSGAGTRWQHKEAHNIGPDEYDITKCREGEKKIIKEGFCLKCGAWKGQLGLEPTPELYIEHMTAIFHEVKRVLKKVGVLFLNIGDTYSQSSGHFDAKNPKARQQRLVNNPANLQPKCLCMIPERLAWSLIQDGWILRNKIIWHKPNAMPSSVKDRFSNCWEYLFMFSKNQRYFFDLNGVREPHKTESNIIRPRMGQGQQTKYQQKRRGLLSGNPNIGQQQHHSENIIYSELGKNPGDHWSINTQPFSEAHFAVFPEKLCEKPIRAGCPEEVCKKCGKARERIVETKLIVHKEFQDKGKARIIDKDKYIPAIPRARTGLEGHNEYKTIGWTSCGCNAGFEGGILLDPFCGAGTALFVAKEMRRRYIGIDIKQEYVDMAKKRLAQGVL